MGKGKRLRARRAYQERGGTGFGSDAVANFAALDWSDGFDDADDLDFSPPDEALLDTSACPVANSCAGCGATTGLHAVTSAFSKTDGYDIGCATLCQACDGQSFVHLLTTDEFHNAFARHASHQAEPST